MQLGPLRVWRVDAWYTPLLHRRRVASATSATLAVRTSTPPGSPARPRHHARVLSPFAARSGRRQGRSQGRRRGPRVRSTLESLRSPTSSPRFGRARRRPRREPLRRSSSHRTRAGLLRHGAQALPTAVLQIHPGASSSFDERGSRPRSVAAPCGSASTPSPGDAAASHTRIVPQLPSEPSDIVSKIRPPTQGSTTTRSVFTCASSWSAARGELAHRPPRPHAFGEDLERLVHRARHHHAASDGVDHRCVSFLVGRVLERGERIGPEALQVGPRARRAPRGRRDRGAGCRPCAPSRDPLPSGRAGAGRRPAG